MLGSSPTTSDALTQLVSLLSNPELLQQRKKELDDIRAGVDRSIARAALDKAEVDKRIKQAEAQETSNNAERDRILKLDAGLKQQQADFRAFCEKERAALQREKQTHKNEAQAQQDAMDAQAKAFARSLKEHEATKAELAKQIKAHHDAVLDAYELQAGIDKKLEAREAVIKNAEINLKTKHSELENALATHSERVKNIRSLIDQMSLSLNQ